MKTTGWRRFQIIDKSRENALVKMLNEKGISRNDLILILRTIRFHPNFDPKTEDQQHYMLKASDQVTNT